VTGWLYYPLTSTTKTGCHDITEILLKVALNTKNQSIRMQILTNQLGYFNREEPSNQFIIIVLNYLLIVLPKRAP